MFHRRARFVSLVGRGREAFVVDFTRLSIISLSAVPLYSGNIDLRLVLEEKTYMEAIKNRSR